MDADLLRTISIFALPLVFAITLHEAAHGYVAKHFGDLTAYAQGRVSLNPLRHVDLVGTIIVPLVILTPQPLRGQQHPLRMGKAGARELRQSAQPEAGHAMGGSGGSRGELRDGALLGDDPQARERSRRTFTSRSR